MSHRPTILTASVLLSLLALTGCSTEPGTTTSPSTTAEPSFYTARVIDVLSGDTLRVQMKTGVYHPSESATGEREEVEVPSETIVVKDPSFDAPAPGECGFEESRSYLVTGVLGQQGPEWVLEEDSSVTVELHRDTIETLPETLPEAESEVKLYSINYRNNPASVMLQRGYAQVGELVPAEEGTNTRYSQLNAWQDAGKRTAERNLWGSCWSE
ncbi:endonuclease YncB(thermonuclease family) [Brevibacterium pityocampae]